MKKYVDYALLYEPLMIDPLKQSEIADFLLSIDPFSSISRSIIEEMVPLLEIVHVKGGSTLIHQGSLGHCMYVILHGRLKVYRHSPDKSPTFIKELGVGELVGEIALITEETRTATVRTIRDSVLLKFSQEAFKSFVLKHPDVLLNFTRICINRLLHTPATKTPHTTLRTIVVAPAATNPLFKIFIDQFVLILTKTNKILHLNSSNFNEALHSTAWLNAQESKYQYIIYESDSELTSWTQRCLRQADLVLFVGLSGQVPELNLIESFFFKTQTEHAVSYDLVLLHETRSVTPNGTELWTHLRHNIFHHHLCLTSPKDYNKLIRFISGKAIGLVLSGGGARGFAHLGVLKALEELEIPIDYIAGSSMGSVFAGAYALGMDYQTLLNRTKELLLPAVEDSDYTLPILSLKSGKPVSQGLQKAFGLHFQVKDCWINFFCVSTNLSESCIKIHNKGILWENIRASISIPAIFPPVIDENGDMLVDGGILNNMPVDVMKNYINGGFIIAVSSQITKEHHHYTHLPPWVSGWKLLTNQFTPGNQEEKIPNIAELIMEIVCLSGDPHQIRMEKEADYCLSLNLSEFGLLDFKNFQKIIDIGYETAIKNLGFLKEL